MSNHASPATTAGCIDGDEDAYKRALCELRERLLPVARRFVRDDGDAEDVVQEACLLALRGLPHYRGEAQVSTWLYRIVVNAGLARLRYLRRRPEESIDVGEGPAAGEAAGADGVGLWLLPSDELLERRQAQARIRAAMARLPDAQQVVLRLRDIEDRDTDETARILGISSNAVKIRVHRARRALRALIESDAGARLSAEGHGREAPR